MRHLVTLSALLAVPAAAQWPAPVERALSAQYNRCSETGDAGRGVTGAMVACAATELRGQDVRLNQAYRKTMQRLTPSRRTTLRDLQRGWIARRDRTCRAEASGDGTIAPLNGVMCTLRMTIERRLWLERYR